MENIQKHFKEKETRICIKKNKEEKYASEINIAAADFIVLFLTQVKK